MDITMCIFANYDVCQRTPGSFSYTYFCLYATTPQSIPGEAREARGGREARGKPPGQAQTYKAKTDR